MNDWIDPYDLFKSFNYPINSLEYRTTKPSSFIQFLRANKRRSVCRQIAREAKIGNFDDLVYQRSAADSNGRGTKYFFHPTLYRWYKAFIHNNGQLTTPPSLEAHQPTLQLEPQILEVTEELATLLPVVKTKLDRIETLVQQVIEDNRNHKKREKEYENLKTAIAAIKSHE